MNPGLAAVALILSAAVMVGVAVRVPVLYQMALTAAENDAIPDAPDHVPMDP